MTASFVIFQPKAFVSSLESSIEDTPVEPPSVVPEVSTPAGPPKITMRKKKEVVPVAVTETATEEVVVVTKTSSKREYEILTSTPTNAGNIVDMKVTNFGKTTSHTLVISTEWTEGIAASHAPSSPIPSNDLMCKYVMHFLLEKGMKIENTEGMIDAAVFPINYFSARQINYFYDDAEETLGKYIGEELSI